MNLRTRLAIVVLLGALVTSCSSGNDGATPTPGATDTTVAVTGSTVPTSSAPASSGPTSPASTGPGTAPLDGPEAVFGDGAFDLAVPAVGLDSLSSYTATLVLSFAGNADGQPKTWARTYTMSVTREPAARQIVLDVADDPAADDPIERTTFTEIDGVVYEARADGRCVVTNVDEEEGLGATWEPAGFLSGVLGADAAGEEDVDGIAARHYTFDEQAIGQQDVAASVGELWVSAADGHLLKYHLDTTGNADYFGLDAEGTLTHDYSLTDVGSVTDIELPDTCRAARVDAPIADDASDIRRSPGRLSFVTALTVADLTAFYETELGGDGWTPAAEPEVIGDTTVLEFTKGDEGLTVVIRTSESGTKVTVLRTTPLP